MRVSATIVAVEKQQVIHILSVSIACGIQHAGHMHPIILSCMACPALKYFSILSH